MHVCADEMLQIKYSNWCPIRKISWVTECYICVQTCLQCPDVSSSGFLDTKEKFQLNGKCPDGKNNNWVADVCLAMPHSLH